MSESTPTVKKPTILETIYAQRAKDVELAKSTPGSTPADLASLFSMNLAPPLIPLVERLKRNPSSTTSTPSPSLMAEIKRASPSKGPIALSTNPAQQALIYALSGASVISVLTEPSWFKGSLLDMRLARQAVDALPDRPAILRKEFILDEYQIVEARLHGADTVLLIVAMLSPERLQALYSYSLSLGMEPLVEVNNAKEMDLALKLGAKVVGVNNRNLHDFNVDMGTTSRLVEMVRERDVILCALSGISNPNDIQVYKEQGVRAVLIGEALMRAEDTSAFIRELLQWPEPPKEAQEKPWIMVSGITSVDEAISFVEKGADILGLVFDASNGQFHVPLKQAAEISGSIQSHRRTNSDLGNSKPSSSPAPWFTAQQRHLQSSGARPLLVGIFRNYSLSDIIHATLNAKLDMVQLDESVPVGWVKHIPVPVIRRFRPQSIDITYPSSHSFCLVEGSATDLTAIVELVGRGEAPKWPLPVILSGALVTGNPSTEAIRSVRPWALEISVERDSPTSFEEIVKAVKAI